MDDESCPKVYIPHLNTRQDPITQAYTPAVNLQPAARIGKVVALLNKPRDPIPERFRLSSQKVRRGMRDFDSERDYLVLAGDPLLMAVAIHEALQRHPVVRVMRWDRSARAYELVEIHSEQSLTEETAQ